MDDNKILTLASNERIVLKPHMRMIFEIRDLRFATPATVSRAGILFISDSSGSQWKAYVRSWIAKKKNGANYDDEKKSLLTQFFDKYVPETFLHCKKTFKYLVPASEIAIIISICKLIESIMDKHVVKAVEYVFVFACIWCIGGGFAEKDGHDYRKEFSNWWKDKFKATVKFPAKGTVFDYYVDLQESKLEEWAKLQQGNEIEKLIDTSKSISNYTVPTVDTISAQYIMKQFISVGHAPMLVGNAGCGKT
jgi:dynein heavy chain